MARWEEEGSSDHAQHPRKKKIKGLEQGPPNVFLVLCTRTCKVTPVLGVPRGSPVYTLCPHN